MKFSTNGSTEPKDKSINSNNSDLVYINNLAEGVIFSQRINPFQNNLVAVFGNGHELNNRQAIVHWVTKKTEEWPTPPDNPLPILKHQFIDLIEENLEVYS